MALALDIVAQNLNLKSVYSFGTNAANKIIGKCTAKKSDGTAYDFTSATGISMVVMPSSSSPGWNTALPVTLGTHDATGLGFSIDSSDLETMVTNNQGNASYQYSLTATDGSNTVLAATGSLNVAGAP